MTLNRIRSYCLSKPGAVEEFPFGPEWLVVKVAGKMFALLAIAEEPLRVNLKCDPDHAEALRAFYPAVVPGYHMNKRHWNTVRLDGSIPKDELLSMVDDSYALVVASLPKGVRAALENQKGEGA